MNTSIKTIKTAFAMLTLGLSLVACSPNLNTPFINSGLSANTTPSGVSQNASQQEQMMAAILAGSQNNSNTGNAYAMDYSGAAGYSDYSGYAGYADYSGYAQQQPQEKSAWADTCGPNADYNEQLVCSGVPASMLP